MAFIYDLTDTWNAGGTTFNAIKMNVTDTASAAASKLVTLQVGGSEKFSVRKDGQGYFAGNVGIGTSAPSQLLHVQSASGAAGSAVARLAASGSTGLEVGQEFFSTPTDSTGALRSGRIYSKFDGISYTDARLSFQSVTSGNTLVDTMHLKNGNVGIGETSPGSWKLNVRSGSTSKLRLYNDTGNGNVIDFLDQSWQSQINGSAGNLLFNTGGTTERMRITSAGNVGIGTSSPVAYSGYSTLTIQNTNGGVINLRNGAATAQAEIAVTSAETYISAVSALPLTLKTTNTERMRIDSSGNLLVGTTTANGSKLRVSAADGTYPLGVSGTTKGLRVFTSASELRLDAVDNTLAASYEPFSLNGSLMKFSTGNTERMRIDASGNLLVGTTTPMTGTSSHEFRTTTADVWPLTLNANNRGLLVRNSAAGSGFYALFEYNGGTANGSITWSGGTTSYNTSSDYRLKDIDGPIQNSGAYIDALKPVQGSWKADGSRFIGLLAHEVQEVSETQIATGEKDGGEMQAMDYSAPEIIANLIAEIQSLRARVAQLEGN